MPERMNAVLFDRYGPPAVLSLREVERPVCRSSEMLVRIRAAGVNPKDCLVRKGKFRWFTGRRFPLGLGHDFAGTVERVGRGVDGFQAGEAVFGMTNGWKGRTYAAFAAVSPAETAMKPAELTFEAAAAVPLAAQTALQALRDLGRLAGGGRVLINGASGGVGTFAIQIACLLGARVTAVCSGRNADLVRRLGAEQVIDYQREDLRNVLHPVDVFFDVFGNRRFPDVRPFLTPRGHYIATVPGLPVLKWGVLSRLGGGPRAHLVVVKSRAADLQTLADWIVGGRLVPVLDRTFPLEDVQQAHAYIETKRARGKVVLTVA
jgi:NADPH:quinone reductase-like Zn-dependent oxidoreductase